MSYIALGCQDLAWIGARLTATYTKTGWGLPEALIPPLPYVTNNWDGIRPRMDEKPRTGGREGRGQPSVCSHSTKKTDPGLVKVA